MSNYLNRMMKTFKPFLLLSLIFTYSLNVFAETWDEPWQKEIIQKSDYFVLANVLDNTDSIGTEIEIIKCFGKQKLTGKIIINGFSLLNLKSASGHGLHLDFDQGDTFYFFLTKQEDGNYAIPTPTSGFARVDENKSVYATYRHSYHQALVPQDVYEKTYSEIWDYYHTGQFNKENISSLIDENIAKKPAGFDTDDISIFFLQHVALETAYLLDLEIELDRIQKFVEFDNIHLRISSLQLLSNSDTKQAKTYLFDFIKSDKNENFEKVIAIWSLSKIGGKKYKKKLKDIANDLSDEPTGFGGNLMDPRVGTYFPSPRAAVEALK